jgi:hypothetical protein
MIEHINVTKYVMHIDPNEELFIDFARATIKNPRYFREEKYLRVEINDELVFFQAETEETRRFIRDHLGVIL